jgi:murein L,D-transpeptidase YcbB/YkuD
MKKMAFLSTLMALAMGGQSLAADTSAWIRDTLENSRRQVDECTSEAQAIDGTLSRISNVSFPATGKVIVVNIPSGVVTAYDDGVPVIESKAVVGKASTPTPEMQTHVTFVRPNPTWTVPKSIVKSHRWLAKLASEPEFFEENHFEVIAHGHEVSPYDAAEDPSSVDTFVQKPGPGNALGAIKIGIDNDKAIYLHDTNDPGKFDSEVRAASAGCVRVERVADIAAWVLDIDPSEMQKMVDDGSTDSVTPPEPVKVIIGYWTAWPDSSGQTRFYPDIYDKDRSCSPRARDGREDEAGGDTAPRDESVPASDREDKPAPRFIPDDGAAKPGIPTWTEYEAR